jgi:hypothetical protein
MSNVGERFWNNQKSSASHPKTHTTDEAVQVLYVGVVVTVVVNVQRFGADGRGQALFHRVGKRR